MTDPQERIDKLEAALTRLVETVTASEKSNALAHQDIMHNLSAVQTELARHSSVEDEHNAIIFGKDGKPGILELTRQNTAIFKRLSTLGWTAAGSAIIGVAGFLIHLYRTIPVE